MYRVYNMRIRLGSAANLFTWPCKFNVCVPFQHVKEYFGYYKTESKYNTFLNPCQVFFDFFVQKEKPPATKPGVY